MPPVSNAVTADTKGNGSTATPVPFPTSYTDGDVARPLPADPNPTDPLSYQRGLALQALADPPALANLTADQKNAYGRGAYLVTIAGCNSCHTNPDRDLNPTSQTYLKINTAGFLSGGRVFAVPGAQQPTLKEVRVMSADLTGMTNGSIGANITATLFPYVLVQYKHVEDPAMLPLGFPMPQVFGQMVYSDLEALYTYLSTLPRLTGAGDKATQDYARYCTMATQATDCNMAGGEVCSGVTGECIGRSCTVDSDCNACQTCTAAVNTCAAPLAASSCVANGI